MAKSTEQSQPINIHVEQQPTNGSRWKAWIPAIMCALAVGAALGGIADAVYARSERVAQAEKDIDYMAKLQASLNERFDTTLKELLVEVRDLNKKLSRLEMRQVKIEARLVPKHERVPIPDDDQ